MPKMKTKSGAAKRFKVRAGGSVKRSQAFKRHILTKKTTKNKRQLARHGRSPRNQQSIGFRHDALRIRSRPCQE